MRYSFFIYTLFCTFFVFFYAWSSDNSEKTYIESQKWTFQGLLGTYDKMALQRGLQVFREVCSSCHSLEYVRFGNLGEKGGPYYYDDYPSVQDNPFVAGLAESYMISEIDEEGESTQRKGNLLDTFPSPYDNDNQAKAANNGALPPDLSLIISSRKKGYNYVYSLLTGYQENKDLSLSPGQYYNAFAKGNIISMSPPLAEGMIDYSDGTEATVEQMARDVVYFLTWASDPHREKRHRIGIIVVVYIFFMSLVLYLSYRSIRRASGVHKVQHNISL